MAFDDAGITVTVTPLPATAEVLVTWSSSWPDGTWYQVYLDAVLIGATQRRAMVLPWPGTATGRAWVHVGAVPASEVAVVQPPAAPAALGTGARPVLTWKGGMYQKVAGRDVAGWTIFRGRAPGGAVDTAAPVGAVPAQGVVGPEGGWGVGGWGTGGWGRPRRTYQFRDQTLAGGTWNYRITPVNDQGQPGAGSDVSVAVTAPPRSPTPVADDPWGRRLIADTSGGSPRLRWGHSPDWSDPAAPVDEVQRIAVRPLGADGGSVTLDYGGATATVPALSPAVVVQQLLEDAIAALAGNITCTGGPLGAQDVTVTFGGALAGTDITAGLTVASDDLTGPEPSYTTTIETDQQGSP